MTYTAKQLELMKMWQHGELKRLNLLEGSVSSGKTWVSLVLWAFWVATMPQDAMYLMCAKSMTTLKRNCLILLQELVGDSNFVYSIPAKEGYLFGRRILLEGVNDVRAESKIRGLTLQGAYCDELTQFPEDFFTMLLSRLRLPGAKLIATTNPDSPGHWLMRDYIMRADELDFLDMKFVVDDNTTLPAEYVESIKREYTGVYYDRFILGLWVLAEGRIYDMFDNGKNVAETLPELAGDSFVSCDYGTQNATVFLLWRKERGGERWFCEREYYYSGRDQRKQKTDGEFADDLTAWLDGRRPRAIVIDPAAASFIAEVRQRGYPVQRADNDVLDGIRNTAERFARGQIVIHGGCSHLLAEIESYAWDEKSSMAGLDRPVKVNDHACDALRYFVSTILGRQVVRPKRRPTGL